MPVTHEPLGVGQGRVGQQTVLSDQLELTGPRRCRVRHDPQRELRVRIEAAPDQPVALGDLDGVDLVGEVAVGRNPGLHQLAACVVRLDDGRANGFAGTIEDRHPCSGFELEADRVDVHHLPTILPGGHVRALDADAVGRVDVVTRGDPDQVAPIGRVFEVDLAVERLTHRR